MRLLSWWWGREVQAWLWGKKLEITQRTGSGKHIFKWPVETEYPWFLEEIRWPEWGRWGQKPWRTPGSICWPLGAPCLVWVQHKATCLWNEPRFRYLRENGCKEGEVALGIKSVSPGSRLQKNQTIYRVRWWWEDTVSRTKTCVPDFTVMNLVLPTEVANLRPAPESETSV